MQTYQVGETIFCFNADLRGEVVIRHHNRDMVLPAETLLRFVADLARSSQIEKLQNTPSMELLEIKPPVRLGY